MLTPRCGNRRAADLIRHAAATTGGHMRRRQFIVSATAAATACGLLPLAQAAAQDQAQPRLRKTLKYSMIRIDGSMADKFIVARKAGFEGVELAAPGFDVAEVKAAMEVSGIIVDGTVNADHWNVRHTDPDPEVRAAALKSCVEGLRATAAIGGDTMLLVPGHGKDGTAEEVYQRALGNIRQAIPVAEEVGVKIAIENVWNHFLYDHDGGSDQTADELARFVDDFQSPWVAVHFDIGNHWKYGDPAEWIRTLDHRIVKLDTKGFSRQQDKFTRISESDIDWASVRQALEDIDFRGWVAAEVRGGDLEELKRVSREIDETLATA